MGGFGDESANKNLAIVATRELKGGLLLCCVDSAGIYVCRSGSRVLQQLSNVVDLKNFWNEGHDVKDALEFVLRQDITC